MYKTSPSFVLGFHGCERSVGEAVLSGNTAIHDSTNDYDWLGRGVYFWENNPARALSFATNAQNLAKIKEPFVIGAVIDLGYCLDLTTEDALSQIKATFAGLEHASRQPGGMPLKANKPMLRFLDCQVIEALHLSREMIPLPAYASVKSPFWEGEPLYPGTDFMHETHIQICVRERRSIKGWFRVLGVDGYPVEFIRQP